MSVLLTYSRRLLGANLSNRLRNLIVDLCSFTRLVPPADLSGKPDGISALVRVKNEKWWIEPSLLSIKDLVQEYVIVDSSTDGTSIIIKEIREKWGLNIIHIIDFDEDLVRLSNKGLKLTNFKWVLRWDADFIACENMPRIINDLINNLSRRNYYVVYWPHICLDGDLFHQKSTKPLQTEHWLFTYSPRTTFIQIPHGYEYLYTPSYYAKRLSISRPLSFHLKTVKPPERLLFRKYREEALSKDLFGKIRYEDYVKKRILEEYNTENIEKASKLFWEDFQSRLSPYEVNKYGDYPRILKEYAKEKFNITI
jgi:hypothetical protein